MILLDANVLLYAYDASSPHHDEARQWFERAVSEERDLGLGVATVLAFLRLGTDVRVFANPLSVDEACAIVESWLSRENVHVIYPADGHWARLRGVAAEGKARGALLMDAHLATLAIERGAKLATTDRDFARFRGLGIIDPLDA